MAAQFWRVMRWARFSRYRRVVYITLYLRLRRGTYERRTK